MSTENDGSPKTAQIGRQKMMGILKYAQIGRQKITGSLRQTKWSTKNYWGLKAAQIV